MIFGVAYNDTFCFQAYSHKTLGVPTKWIF